MATNITTFTDLPATTDLFGLNPYIDGLAEFINMCATPLTIAIQGDWGSGKTSMMEMTKQKLSNKIYPVWFNTWQYSQFNLDSELSISFMREIVETIGAKPDAKSSFSKALGVIGAAVKHGAVFVADNLLSERVGDAIGNMVDSYGNASVALAVKHLRSEFDKCVSSALKDSNKEKLVIFVDDLDRLNPARAIELLEVLKNYLDCEHYVFVLAVDSSVVFQGVREKYGADISPAKARSFFDKIIQVPFKMPVDIYNITNYVKDALDKLKINTKDDELEILTNIIRLSIGNNPRSMKRLFNSYNLLEFVIKSIGKGTLNDQSKQMLFAILCMQNSFEYTYKFLVLSQESITDTLLDQLIDSESEIYKNAEMDDDDKALFAEFFNEIIALIDSDKNGEVSKVELELFKKTLEYSAITSTSTISSSANTSKIMPEIRYKHKEFIEQLCTQLNKKYKKQGCKFKLTFKREDSHSQYATCESLKRLPSRVGRGEIIPAISFGLHPSENPDESSLSVRFFAPQYYGMSYSKNFETWLDYFGENPLNANDMHVKETSKGRQELVYKNYYIINADAKPGNKELFNKICEVFDCVKDKFEIIPTKENLE